MKETAWEAGAFGGAAGRRRALLFGRMYEDPEIERAAFRGRRRVFAIASAGCTAMALSRDHEVVACDINPVQLEYARRRLAGAPRETGSAERVMALARRMAVLAGWSEGRLREFLALGDVREQGEYWRRHLDTWRYRTGFDLVLSPRWLRLVYSSELLAFLPDDFGRVLRERLARGFATHPNATNPYARALLLGEEKEAPAAAASPVELVEADAASFLERAAPGSFDAFTLSNILDGATSAYRDRLWSAVARAAAPGAIAVLRSFGEPSARTAENCAAQDRSMLWGSVEIRAAR